MNTFRAIPAPLFRSLGLLEAIEAQGHPPCARIVSAWGSEDVVESDGVRSPFGGGWLVNRTRFDALLIQHARASGTRCRAARLVGHRRKAGAWQLSLDTGRDLKVHAVIDASGRSACLARRIATPPRHHDRLVALVAVLPMKNSSTVLIEAAEEGWWYRAVPSSGSGVLAFFTDADLLEGESVQTSMAPRTQP